MANSFAFALSSKNKSCFQSNTNVDFFLKFFLGRKRSWHVVSIYLGNCAKKTKTQNKKEDSSQHGTEQAHAYKKVPGRQPNSECTLIVQLLASWGHCVVAGVAVPTVTSQQISEIVFGVMILRQK